MQTEFTSNEIPPRVAMATRAIAHVEIYAQVKREGPINLAITRGLDQMHLTALRVLSEYMDEEGAPSTGTPEKPEQVQL